LIQQGLKHVVVVTIDQRHLHGRVPEGARAEQPAESAPDDHDARSGHARSNGTLLPWPSRAP